MSHKISIKKSSVGIAFYIPPAVTQHLGGPGSHVLVFAKKESEGLYSVFIRENPQGKAKIIDRPGIYHSHTIDIRGNPPVPLDRWPLTPAGEPYQVRVTFDQTPKRQISFTVNLAEMAKGTGKIRRNERPEVVIDHKPIVAKSFNELADLVKDAPIYAKIPEFKDKIPEFKDKKATPHQELNMMLKVLNAAFTPDLNDVELFVERIDAEGNVIETITLPVPSQMRIKGRVIREETFG